MLHNLLYYDQYYYVVLDYHVANITGDADLFEKFLDVIVTLSHGVTLYCDWNTFFLFFSNVSTIDNLFSKRLITLQGHVMCQCDNHIEKSLGLWGLIKKIF